jgi:SAM-dependent methyltransferase
MLPPRGYLPRTGAVDFVDSYFDGGVGWVLRERLRWVRDALPANHVSRVLEIGYGSGIFLYELVDHADMVVGIDVHGLAADVQRHVRADGLRVPLIRGDGMHLPFDEGAFDLVIIVSALEFMDDPATCLRESMRVVRGGGQVIGVRPRAHPVLDLAFRMISGTDPEADFQGGRERVARAFAEVAPTAEMHPRPALLPRAVAPYDLFILRRPESSEGQMEPKLAMRVRRVDFSVDGSSSYSPSSASPPAAPLSRGARASRPHLRWGDGDQPSAPAPFGG